MRGTRYTHPIVEQNEALSNGQIPVQDWQGGEEGRYSACEASLF